MKPVLEALDKILADPAARHRGSQHSSYLVKEVDSNATLRSVVLELGTGEWLAFSPDKMRGRRDGKKNAKPALMSALLADDEAHGHHKACDAVVVRCEGAACDVVLVELKSKVDRSGFSKQFVSTECFSKYLVEILARFHDLRLEELQFHHVVFFERTNKQTTVPVAVSTTAEVPRKIQVTNGETVSWRRLLGLVGDSAGVGV